MRLTSTYVSDALDLICDWGRGTVRKRKKVGAGAGAGADSSGLVGNGLLLKVGR